MSLLDRKTQLRWRRILRRRQKQVEAVTEAAEQQLESNLIGRFDRFWKVKRFAFGWLGLVVLITAATIIQTLALSGYYQTPQPTAGGTYDEGIVGTYSNANPIYATGAVDTAVSRLIFAGLFKYSNQNKLVGDLATGYSADPTAKHFVVKLRHHLTWQDGRPLTAKDVAFTFHLIQNPDASSPLLASWQNIQITAPDNYTVDFDLPNSFSAFPYSLLTGIVPEHLLAHVPASELRSASFNTTAPVGAGPFAWQALQTSEVSDPDKSLSLIALKPFENYAGGKPKLSRFVVHAFGSTDMMIAAFQKRTINAMTGLETTPDQIKHGSSVSQLSFPSTAAKMVFFKTSSGVLADAAVRQALIESADTASIIQQLDYATRPVREPLLAGQLGYDTKYAQASFNAKAAKTALSKAGWALSANDGVRLKKGQQLTFHLYGLDTDENRLVMKTLVQNWADVGVEAIPVLQSPTDFQTTLEFHTYDALLNNISLGPDPDVYPYWDSSQNDIRSSSRLNFSEYKSSAADAALEAGRTRLDPALRVIKYKPFLQAWQADAPALGLYQPRFLYITRGPVYNLTEHTINTDADRYASVAKWEIHTARVTNK